jgi:hypothetical protein
VKQLYILTFILLLFCQSIQSQTFHGGFFAGISASQVDGDSYAGYNKAGAVAGVFISTRLYANLGARLEFRYAARGAKNKTSDDNTGLYQLGLHYIDIPVMLTYSVKKIGEVKIGLIPGYLFSARGEDDNGKLPDDYLVEFNKFDLGSLIGISINLMPKIALDFNYSYSILSIRNQNSEGSYYSWFGKLFGNSTGDYNNYIIIGLNYLIR